jgi:hypothetical protein
VEENDELEIRGGEKGFVVSLWRPFKVTGVFQFFPLSLKLVTGGG